jgi:peptide subunit release factor 1 (eRF1)
MPLNIHLQSFTSPCDHHFYLSWLLRLLRNKLRARLILETQCSWARGRNFLREAVVLQLVPEKIVVDFRLLNANEGS